MTHPTQQPLEQTLACIEDLAGRDARNVMTALRTKAFADAEHAVAVDVTVDNESRNKKLVPIGDLTRPTGTTERFFIETRYSCGQPQTMPRLFFGIVSGDRVQDCNVIEWPDLEPSDWQWLAREMKSHTPRI